MSTFTGFSEEDLKRAKSGEIRTTGNDISITPEKKLILRSTRNKTYQYKTAIQQKQIDDVIDDLQFDKCRLSIKPTATAQNESDNNKIDLKSNSNIENINNITNNEIEYGNPKVTENGNITESNEHIMANSVVNVTPDVVRGVDYAEDDLASHRVKLEELQVKQKIMEEQNKKRKEMLAKALADRTRQTEEEVMKLEKIKKELQVLDGQFSQDVGVLRKKIDLACLSYADAEKHYLKVEKEFLQAKIQLQKEKEKKELLTEHLCALITHNETRKAQKLETLMLELASNRKQDIPEPKVNDRTVDDEGPVIVDGVDQRTGKMVEMNGDS